MAEADTLEPIERFIRSRAAAVGLTVDEFFSTVTRRAMDEVIDGSRTGRWNIGQLSKTEKTYIGTKIEILTRAELGVACGARSDCLIAGSETDIKWSMNDAAWMIGPENVEQICLGICTDRNQASVSVALFIAYADRLSKKANRDKKRSLLGVAKREISWLVRRAPLPQNFLAKLSEEVRDHVFAGSSAQDRVRRLAEAMPLMLIPRQAFETVAMRPDGDPLRRLRQDRYNAAALGGMRVLHTGQKAAEVRQILGLTAESELPKDHWLAVPDDLYFRLFPRGE